MEKSTMMTIMMMMTPILAEWTLHAREHLYAGTWSKRYVRLDVSRVGVPRMDSII